MTADVAAKNDLTWCEQKVRLEILTEWPALCALEGEWNALWLRAQRPFVLQSFAVADVIRRIPLYQRNAQLWCLVGRARGELALVWPFFVYRNHGLRLATPIGGELDCSDPLVVDGAASRAFLRSAWAILLRKCPCDVFQFRFVRDNMPLRELILQTYWRVPIYELDVPSVEFSGDWNTYAQQLSKKQRSSLARKHRRLLDLGDIKFEELPYDTPGVAEWIVEHKRKWLVRNALEDKVQLTHPMFIKFLNGLLAALGPEARCLVFAIRQGERLIAADVSFVDRHAVQWKIGTFDEEFGKYSPGQLLKEMAVRWAFDHGLIYDMLAGGGQHKDYLATKIERATTWRVGRTALGRCYIAIRRLLQRAGFPSMITPGR